MSKERRGHWMEPRVRQQAEKEEVRPTRTRTRLIQPTAVDLLGGERQPAEPKPQIDPTAWAKV